MAFVRFSVRSVGLVTLGVGIQCSLFLNTSARIEGSLAYVIVWLVLFMLAWVIPAASIGFDKFPTSRGILRGAVIGLWLAFLVFVWNETPLHKILW